MSTVGLGLRRRKANMIPMAMTPRTAKPPMTPPTIAPTGTDLDEGAGTADELVGPGLSVVLVGSSMAVGLDTVPGIDIVGPSSSLMVVVTKFGLSSPLYVCSTL